MLSRVINNGNLTLSSYLTNEDSQNGHFIVRFTLEAGVSVSAGHAQIFEGVAMRIGSASNLSFGKNNYRIINNQILKQK